MLRGQTPSAAPQAFDVAAIHRSRPNENGMIKPLAGGHGYTALNIPVKLMISLMYQVPMRQIEGGPEWLSSDGFDVEARVDGAYTVDELHVMYQNLLADRFGLRFHKEVRQGSVYALSLERPAPGLKVSQGGDRYDIPMNGSPGSIVARRVSMPYFCWWLGQRLQRDERPVIDGTGLTQFYDFSLSFAPELPAGADTSNLPPGLLDRPSLPDALRDQLGLKLTPQKGPVPYYVIDHVEKPSAN